MSEFKQERYYEEGSSAGASVKQRFMSFWPARRVSGCSS